MSTIVLRATKGSPLTNTEVDLNFDNLNTDKLQLGGTYAAGTANGVAYLNGSKQLTTGSALVFDGTNLGVGAALPQNYGAGVTSATIDATNVSGIDLRVGGVRYGRIYASTSALNIDTWSGTGPITFGINTNEQMRLTSKALMVGYTSDAGFSGSFNAGIAGSLGIGTSSPAAKLDVNGGALIQGLTVGRGAGAVATNTVIGYTALNSNTTGINNTASGYAALYSNTTGGYNTANGYAALYSNTTGGYNTANGYAALYSNTTGGYNTANGYQALNSNTTGSNNTANGYQALISNTTGNYNTASGYTALLYNTTGSGNTANGFQALNSNTTGSNNTANGYTALNSNTTGSNNTANGFQALNSNTTGSNNTANGLQALYSNTTGYNNTANGVNALISNTTGTYNTASGVQALYSNTTGNNNTANGASALQFNTTGNSNTASGVNALNSNTTGNNNTASGIQALQSNTTGNNNTASGYQALYSNTTGNSNTASGYQALYSNTTGTQNTANGQAALQSNTTGIYNTANGVSALFYNTTGSGNTAINPLNSAGTYTPVFNPTTENNRFCMGSTGVTNAYIQVAWTVVSDARDKTDFAPVPHGLAFVTQLQPTAYRYKMNREDTEGHGPVRYGFKAQEVLALEGNAPVIVDAEDSEKLRFNDQSMIAVLVNAVKELKIEFDLYKSTHP